MTDIPPPELVASLTELLFAIADDKLILGHRNSDWTGLGPILEEDIAFSALAQDEMAHAQSLYEVVAQWTNGNADQLAFGREVNDYRCAAIVELPDDFDWAFAIARHLFCDHLDALRLERLSKSSNAKLAALAKRLAAEETIHVAHSSAWVNRLGTGTDESKTKLQAALTTLARPASMLFERVKGEDELASAGLYPGDGDAMFETWRDTLVKITKAAGLNVTLAPPATSDRGGRRGAHSEHLAPLLAEMGEVFRLAPNARW